MVDINSCSGHSKGPFEVEYLEINEQQGGVRLSEKTRGYADAYESERAGRQIPDAVLKAAVENRFEKSEREVACINVSNYDLAHDESLQRLRRVATACESHLARMLGFISADYPPADKLATRAFGTAKVGTDPAGKRVSWNNLPAIFSLVVLAILICIFSVVEATNIVVILEDSEWLPNATRWQLYCVAVPYTVAFLLVSCGILNVAAFWMQRLFKNSALPIVLAVAILGSGLLALKVGTLQAAGLGQSGPPNWIVSLAAIYCSAGITTVAEILFDSAKSSLWQYRVVLSGYALFFRAELSRLRRLTCCIEATLAELQKYGDAISNWESTHRAVCVNRGEELFLEHIDELKFKSRLLAVNEPHIKSIHINNDRIKTNGHVS